MIYLCVRRTSNQVHLHFTQVLRWFAIHPAIYFGQFSLTKRSQVLRLLPHPLLQTYLHPNGSLPVVLSLYRLYPIISFHPYESALPCQSKASSVFLKVFCSLLVRLWPHLPKHLVLPSQSTHLFQGNHRLIDPLEKSVLDLLVLEKLSKWPNCWEIEKKLRRCSLYCDKSILNTHLRTHFHLQFQFSI